MERKPRRFHGAFCFFAKLTRCLLLRLRRSLLVLRSDLRADYFTANDDFHATIFLTASRGAVIGDWCVLTETGGRDGVRVETLLHQIVAYRVGALLG
jgi:hypothetical protein